MKTVTIVFIGLLLGSSLRAEEALPESSPSPWTLGFRTHVMDSYGERSTPTPRATQVLMARNALASLEFLPSYQGAGYRLGLAVKASRIHRRDVLNYIDIGNFREYQAELKMAHMGIAATPSFEFHINPRLLFSTHVQFERRELIEPEIYKSIKAERREYAASLLYKEAGTQLYLGFKDLNEGVIDSPPGPSLGERSIKFLSHYEQAGFAHDLMAVSSDINRYEYFPFQDFDYSEDLGIYKLSRPQGSLTAEFLLEFLDRDRHEQKPLDELYVSGSTRYGLGLQTSPAKGPVAVALEYSYKQFRGFSKVYANNGFVRYLQADGNSDVWTVNLSHSPWSFMVFRYLGKFEYLRYDRVHAGIDADRSRNILPSSLLTHIAQMEFIHKF